MRYLHYIPYYFWSAVKFASYRLFHHAQHLSFLHEREARNRHS
jgi:hypothetical protein